MPIQHCAPGDTQCAAGGYAAAADVHIPPFKACPRRGATQPDIGRIVERPHGSERVASHRYEPRYSPDRGHWAEEERREGGVWRRVTWWELGHPMRLTKPLEQARLHVAWLRWDLVSPLLPPRARSRHMKN